MTAFDFNGQQVLVVGGSSGIGNGIAQAFRAAGARVQVWGTRAGPDAYRGDGCDLTGLDYRQVDVADTAALAALPLNLNRLDVLVLSQGTVAYKREEFEPPGWNKVMAVNLHSLMQTAQKCHRLLAAAHGKVIIVSSTAGFRAARGNPAYAASKAAAVGLTRTLGQAWATDRIRVNGLAPGLVDTKLTKVTTENPKRLRETLARIPVNRLGTPQDMAGVALFLASPHAGYVCGHTILVDGGLTL